MHWTVLLFSPSSPRSVEKMKSNSFGKNEVLIYWLFLLEFDRIKELLPMMTEQLLCIAATTHKAIISYEKSSLQRTGAATSLILTLSP